MSRFSDEEIRRYGRQMLLREVGGRGQQRLRAAQLQLRSVGATGASAADYLRRAGLGALRVELSPCGPSVLSDPTGPIAWAVCDGLEAEVGTGQPPPAGHGAGDGEAALCAGALLALLGLQHLLGLLPAGRRLRVDLAHAHTGIVPL
ncbi:MAG: hypothetical protein RMK29_22260 [Myxococcales bacterium]|nr:hypothetical protein [Myxococcota bacterium]MDW8284440.1 hypothetical protein [Myxococcales bacterium]